MSDTVSTPTAPKPAESRVKKTLLNARVNLIFYFLTLLLSFFSRKIFLDCLGADFVGLTGTLQNLLGFLNLAELGVGSAIGYLLYKPLYDHDQIKINEIISVMGYMYRWIGFIILGAGCILSCFLPWIFPDSDTGFHLSLIYFAYFAFLGSSLIGYFINYRQNLLGADQRNYVVTAYFQTANLVKVMIQMALAYYTQNLYLWVVVEFTFGIIYSFILNWKINQTYPWLKAEVKLGRKLFKKYPEVMSYTKKIFLHKVGIVTQWQSTPILIYTYTALSMVAIYNNYTIIIDKIVQACNSVLSSSEAGVGNLIAGKNISKIRIVFWEIMTIRFFIAGLVALELSMFASKFIEIWIGPEYVMNREIVILLIVNLIIPLVHNVIGQFTYGFGLFNDVWATLTQSGMFIIGSIILAPFYGLLGIMYSAVLSNIFSYMLWKPYYLYSKGFKISVVFYWRDWLKIAVIIFISVFIAQQLSNSMLNWLDLSPVVSLVVGILMSSALYIIICGILNLLLLSSAKSLIGRILKRKI